MPDKKLTDSEIVKALECCSTYHDVRSCKNCPLDGKCEPNMLEQYALDLINRQEEEKQNLKAEVERLKSLNSRLEAENYSFKVKERENPVEMALLIDEQAEQLKTAKAEAYKAFAERLKEYREIVSYDRDFDAYVYGSHIHIDIDEFDNLVKEMVGE